MWLNTLKITSMQAILILLISIPGGYFIYDRNVSKVNYVFSIESGSLYSENYCEKYADFGAPSILKNSQIVKMQNTLTAHINQDNLSNRSNVYINYSGVNSPYQIVIAGRDQNLNLMSKQIEFARKLLSEEEMRTFEQKFSKVKIICQGKNYPAFTYLPPNNQVIEGAVRYAYSKNFLYISALVPLLALYILILIYKIIRCKSNDFVFKNKSLPKGPM